MLFVVLWCIHLLYDHYSAHPPTSLYEWIQVIALCVGSLLVTFVSTFSISPVVDKVLYRAYYCCAIYWIGSGLLDLMEGGRLT